MEKHEDPVPGTWLPNELLNQNPQLRRKVSWRRPRKKKDSCLSDAPIVVLVVGTDKRPVSQASELLVGVGLNFLYWAAIIQTQESIKPH